MEGNGYARLDRGDLLRALETRLSANQYSSSGPQVQLFRIKTQVPALPNVSQDERPCYQGLSEQASIIDPTENLKVYNERARAMKATIDRSHVIEPGRQHGDENARAAQSELEKVKIQLAALEEPCNIADFKEAQQRKALQETDDTCCLLMDTPSSRNQ